MPDPNAVELTEDEIAVVQKMRDMASVNPQAVVGPPKDFTPGATGKVVDDHVNWIMADGKPNWTDIKRPIYKFGQEPEDIPEEAPAIYKKLIGRSCVWLQALPDSDQYSMSITLPMTQFMSKKTNNWEKSDFVSLGDVDHIINIIKLMKSRALTIFKARGGHEAGIITQFGSGSQDPTTDEKLKSDFALAQATVEKLSA